MHFFLWKSKIIPINKSASKIYYAIEYSVEQSGIEPPTSCLQSTRSPS